MLMMTLSSRAFAPGSIRDNLSFVVSSRTPQIASIIINDTMPHSTAEITFPTVLHGTENMVIEAQHVCSSSRDRRID